MTEEELDFEASDPGEVVGYLPALEGTNLVPEPGIG